MAHRRRNPSLLGQDLEDRALQGLGIAATSVLNKNVARPIVDRFANVSGMAAKAVDAASTVATAYGVRTVVGLVSRPVANRLFEGGFILGVGKAIGAVIPGYQLDGNLSYLERVRVGSAPLPAAPAPAALPAGSAAPTTGGAFPLSGQVARTGGL